MEDIQILNKIQVPGTKSLEKLQVPKNPNNPNGLTEKNDKVLK
jgi:hypothetical protein